MRNLILPVLLVVMLLPHPAAAETARLDFDLAGDRVRVRVGSEDRTADLPPKWGDRLASFRLALAEGRWNEDESRWLGEGLVLAMGHDLDGVDRWEVTSVGAAPLSALRRPDGRFVLETTVVWYRAPLREQDPVSLPVRARGGVLALVPFTPGLDPLIDDSFFLLNAIRRDLRRLDLVPRNDTTSQTVVATLADDEYALTLLRAAPEIAAPLLTPLSTGPPLVWWTRATQEQNAEASSVAETLRQCTLFTEGGKSMACDLWPVNEEQRADASRAFIQALQAGATAPEAVATARRSLAERGSPDLWAGWIYVGHGELRADPAQRSWWQRFLGR